MDQPDPDPCNGALPGRSRQFRELLGPRDHAGGQTYTYTKPWATYTAQLYDRRAGLTVWTASGEVEGNAIATMSQMRSRAVDRTIEQLVKDGVIQ